MLPELANHLIQSTLFAAIAGLVTLTLRNNRAQIRYVLWLAASVKFLIPFSILITAGTHLRTHTPPAIAQSGISTVIEQATEPFTAPAPMSTSLPAPANRIPALLGAVWIIGFGFVLSNWYRRWRNLRAAMRTASPLHLDIEIPAMTSPAFPEPGVYGIFKPILLLPAGITHQLTPAQWKSILAHELCHIRRRDNLATAIHMAVEAVFWFHPLVWWLGARLIEERERACDEEVLREGNEPQTYAEAILKICELYLESPLPCIAGVTGSNLKHRIETIMKNRAAISLNSIRKIALIAAATAALTLPIVVGMIHLPAIHAQAPKFEVISIKPNPVLSGTQFTEFKTKPAVRLTGNRFTQRQTTIQYLLMQAYGVWDYQISGLPDWAQAPNGEHYDVEATVAGEVTPSAEQSQAMLQALLADRFALTLHHDTKDLPVYALSPAKGGTRLQPIAGDPRFGTTMQQLINQLSHVVGRPIVDKTGLPASYDTTAINKLSWGKLGEAHRADPLSVPEALESALEDQFGLKLELRKEPIDELVIDHVEKPSAN
jgi:bla regulator protein blaR1